MKSRYLPLVLVAVAVVLIVPVVLITRWIVGGGPEKGGGLTLGMVLDQHGIAPIWNMGERLDPGTVLKGHDVAASVEAYPDEAFEQPGLLTPHESGVVLVRAECSDEIRVEGKVALKALKALGFSAEASLETLGVTAVETTLSGLRRTEVSSEQLRMATMKPKLLEKLRTDTMLLLAKVVWTAERIEMSMRTKEGYVAAGELRSIAGSVEARGKFQGVQNGRLVYTDKIVGFTPELLIDSGTPEDGKSVAASLSNAGVHAEVWGSRVLVDAPLQRLPLVVNLAQTELARGRLAAEIATTKDKLKGATAALGARDAELAAAKLNMERQTMELTEMTTRSAAEAAELHRYRDVVEALRPTLELSRSRATKLDDEFREACARFGILSPLSRSWTRAEFNAQKGKIEEKVRGSGDESAKAAYEVLRRLADDAALIEALAKAASQLE